jgi:hypothetical protein
VPAKFKVRVLDESEITPEENAMMMINSAYFFSGRKIGFVEDAIYAVRIREAMKEGFTDPDKIAVRAMELEGLSPQFVRRGEIGFYSIEEPEPPKHVLN